MSLVAGCSDRSVQTPSGRCDRHQRDRSSPRPRQDRGRRRRCRGGRSRERAGIHRADLVRIDPKPTGWSRTSRCRVRQPALQWTGSCLGRSRSPHHEPRCARPELALLRQLDHEPVCGTACSDRAGFTSHRGSQRLGDLYDGRIVRIGTGLFQVENGVPYAGPQQSRSATSSSGRSPI
jgi:hypothetical protein